MAGSILHNSDGVYNMAQLPGKPYVEKRYIGSKMPHTSILASYERGVHYVALDRFQLQVWTLTESADCQVGWMLAHEVDLSSYLKIRHHWEPTVWWKAFGNNHALFSLFKPEEDGQKDTTDDVDGDDEGSEESIRDDDDEEEGIHDDENEEKNDTTGAADNDVCHGDRGDSHEDEDDEFKSEEGSRYPSEELPIDLDEDDESISEENFEYSWDSDEDNFFDPDESAEGWEHGDYRILGLHPHKDVVLLHHVYDDRQVVAYHFKTSRMQYLGPQLADGHFTYGVHAGFPYRPCYVDALPSTKLPYCPLYSRNGW